MSKKGSSISSTNISEKEVGAVSNDLDVAAQLAVGGPEETISTEDALRLRRKIDWNLMPLMCILYLMQFADKTTLGQSAILGLTQSTHLTTNQFNWLGTIFYLSYLAFEYPQNLALQKFPVGKWMSLNIFVWSVALCCHAACTSFGELFAVRFILGMCEGAITAGFLIVTSMFYTRAEQMARVGYWFLMNGAAVIILGFIAFGVSHAKTEKFEPWQWLMIITGLITLITSILFWFFFPDSPANARFLTAEEKRLAVLRIKSNQTGVENKHFKIKQCIEAFQDPKTWLFAFIVALNQIPNSLTNQRQLIVNMFGFSAIQTTLLGCVDGVIVSFAIFFSTRASSIIPNFRAYAISLFTIPGIIGGILVITLSFSNRIGLLFSYWTAIMANGCLPVLLGWANSTTSGHSKRVTTNAIILVAYGIGNAAGPFMWKQQYRPRNIVPWAIMITVNGCVGILSLLIRFYLSRANATRAQEQLDPAYDDVYIVVKNEKGEEEKRKVDKEFLDLTDGQNHEFRYVL
ncbi:MFS general substrate transporter [Pyrrhoderma noxium]|uniref:MFS general substrate transporter n=1 Tax=Pyrrhoderma noxium TaxID=2282107 RepID=A0A286UV83_9AGAM|nr:MFS general substrate transporter [Pyrrhoderma noxium]